MEIGIRNQDDGEGKKISDSDISNYKTEGRKCRNTNCSSISLPTRRKHYLNVNLKKKYLIAYSTMTGI